MTHGKYKTPLELPKGFQVRKQLDLEGQWSYASSHYGWSSEWFDEEKDAVKATRRRSVYLANRGRGREVFP
jgi:hypothetical protein